MLIDYIRANLGREVAITARYIQMAFDAQLRQVGNLNGMQVILLMILICDQSMTMEQITRDTGTLGEERAALLKPLFEQGYMRYQPDDPNSVTITEAGERILAQLWSVVERAEQAVLTGFSEAEREQFKAYLRRIQENCMRVIETTEVQI
jgi:RNA methyltransferase, TrmH family